MEEKKSYCLSYCQFISETELIEYDNINGQTSLCFSSVVGRLSTMLLEKPYNQISLLSNKNPMFG